MKMILVAAIAANVLLTACAPIPPIDNRPWTGGTTSNRDNISIMNSESVANAQNSARCGARYNGKVAEAWVSKDSRATVDTDPSADLPPWQRANSNRWNRGNRWNGSGNVNRPINRFLDDSVSRTVIVCD